MSDPNPNPNQNIIRGLLRIQKKQARVIRGLIKEIEKISDYLVELEEYLNNVQGTPQGKTNQSRPKPPEPPPNRLDGLWGKPN